MASDRLFNNLRERNAPWKQVRGGGLGLCPVSVMGRYLTSISVRESPFPSLERFWNASGVKRRRRIRTGLGPRAMKANVVIVCEALECARPPLHFSFQPNSTPVAQAQPSEQPPDCRAPHALRPAASLHFVHSTLGCGDAGLVLAGISGHLPCPAANSLEQDCASGFSFTLPASALSTLLIACLRAAGLVPHGRGGARM